MHFPLRVSRPTPTAEDRGCKPCCGDTKPEAVSYRPLSPPAGETICSSESGSFAPFGEKRKKANEITFGRIDGKQKSNSKGLRLEGALSAFSCKPQKSPQVPSCAGSDGWSAAAHQPAPPEKGGTEGGEQPFVGFCLPSSFGGLEQVIIPAPRSGEPGGSLQGAGGGVGPSPDCDGRGGDPRWLVPPARSRPSAALSRPSPGFADTTWTPRGQNSGCERRAPPPSAPRAREDRAEKVPHPHPPPARVPSGPRAARGRWL